MKLREIPFGKRRNGVRKGECEFCGESAVYGLEELLMMGVLKITEDKAHA